MTAATIPAGLRAQYQRERASTGGRGGPILEARTALLLARYRAKTAEDYGWTEGHGDTLTAERDGFSLRASTEPDYDRSADGYGTFSEEREDDRWAVPMFASGQGYQHTTGDHANAWYHPQDAQGQYDYMRKRGASKATVEEWLRASNRDEATHAAEAVEYVISVTASKAGIVLGRASLGGYELDTDDWDSARQIAAAIEDYGMADEALTEARQTLATLREEDE